MIRHFIDLVNTDRLRSPIPMNFLESFEDAAIAFPGIRIGVDSQAPFMQRTGLPP